jgi:hypothetical protein
MDDTQSLSLAIRPTNRGSPRSVRGVRPPACAGLPKPVCRLAMQPEKHDPPQAGDVRTSGSISGGHANAGSDILI